MKPGPSTKVDAMKASEQRGGQVRVESIIGQRARLPLKLGLSFAQKVGQPFHLEAGRTQVDHQPQIGVGDFEVRNHLRLVQRRDVRSHFVVEHDFAIQEACIGNEETHLNVLVKDGEILLSLAHNPDFLEADTGRLVVKLFR